MPNWVQDEDKWEMAKKIASKAGHKDDYDYITGIYKKMGGKIKKNEKLDRMYNEMLGKNTYSAQCESCGTKFDTAMYETGKISKGSCPNKECSNPKIKYLSKHYNEASFDIQPFLKIADELNTLDEVTRWVKNNNYNKHGYCQNIAALYNHIKPGKAIKAPGHVAYLQGNQVYDPITFTQVPVSLDEWEKKFPKNTQGSLIKLKNSYSEATDNELKSFLQFLMNNNVVSQGLNFNSIIQQFKRGR